MKKNYIVTFFNLSVLSLMSTCASVVSHAEPSKNTELKTSQDITNLQSESVFLKNKGNKSKKSISVLLTSAEKKPVFCKERLICGEKIQKEVEHKKEHSLFDFAGFKRTLKLVAEGLIYYTVYGISGILCAATLDAVSNKVYGVKLTEHFFGK